MKAHGSANRRCNFAGLQNFVVVIVAVFLGPVGGVARQLHQRSIRCDALGRKNDFLIHHHPHPRVGYAGVFDLHDFGNGGFGHHAGHIFKGLCSLLVRPFLHRNLHAAGCDDVVRLAVRGEVRNGFGGKQGETEGQHRQNQKFSLHSSSPIKL